MGYIPVRMGLSMPTVDDTENLSTNPVFLETTLSQHLLIPRSIFNDWCHMRTYDHIRDIPDAMNPFLVDIASSRVVFSSIFVPRDPCDNSEVSVLSRSFFTTHLIETFFCHRMTQKTLGNGRIQCQRRKTSPRTSESDKN